MWGSVPRTSVPWEEKDPRAIPAKSPSFLCQARLRPTVHLGYKCHITQGREGLSGFFPSAKDSAELLGSVMPSHEMSQ